MNKLRIIDLEDVPNRYTCEWKIHVPELFRKVIKENNLDIEVEVVDGDLGSITATQNAFLNFAATNIYKNNQMSKVAMMFQNGEVQEGDIFLFTDGWNPCVIELKYMSDLLGVPIQIHSLFHAGSWDPHDFLGRKISDKRWVNHFEKSIALANTVNWFATDFHIDLFTKGVFGDEINLPNYSDLGDKIKKTGWPMEYMADTLSDYLNTPKEDVVIFPHRLAPEKQPEIFYDLREALPEYEFVICQETQLTKKEYHKELARSKVLFSCSLQETLGICPFEGALLGVMPMVPDRLSYTEMFDSRFKYPSEWTLNFDSYKQNREHVKSLIRLNMDTHGSFRIPIEECAYNLYKNYFSATNLIRHVLKLND